MNTLITNEKNIENSNDFKLILGLKWASKLTKQQYLSNIRGFLQYLPCNIKHIKPHHIIDYLSILRDKYKKSTYNTKMFGLKSVIDKLYADNIIDHNPFDDLKDLKLSESVDDSKDECITIDQVLELTDRTTKTGLIISTLANTGIRCTELISLKKKDISGVCERDEYKDNMIEIFIKTLKHGIDRRIYIDSKLFWDIIERFHNIHHLDEWNSLPDDQLIFISDSNKALSRSNIFIQIRKRVKAKLHIKKYGSHSFRHFFADHQINKLNRSISKVQKALGHKSILSTSTYVHSKLTPKESFLGI